MALTIFIFAASFKTWYPALQLTSSSIVPVVILHRPETGVQLLLSLVGKNYRLQRLQSTSCRDRVTMIGQVLGVRAVRGFGRFQAEAQAIRRETAAKSSSFQQSIPSTRRLLLSDSGSLLRSQKTGFRNFDEPVIQGVQAKVPSAATRMSRQDHWKTETSHPGRLRTSV